jgi:polyisoprenyl-teichoic acid--peptidoglycan teichoic acid transferase
VIRATRLPPRALATADAVSTSTPDLACAIVTATTAQPAINPLLAATVSAFVPGLGQWLAADRRKAKILFIVDGVILAALLFLFRDRIAVAAAFFRPSDLALMMVGNIALLAYRVWAADDAYRTATAAGNTVSRTAGLATVLILGVIVVAPHLWFARIDLIQYDLLTSTFDGGEASASEPDSTQPSQATNPGDPSTTVETTTTTEPPPPWEDLDRLNVLLLGGDFGVGRTGIRTDTMITLSIDPETGEAAFLQIPRNWTYAPLPEGMGIWGCDCYPELINELWVAGEQHPEAFPGPGSPSENAVKGVVSEFLGIPIHYYALVNLDGFAELIDAIGGIDIYVPERIVDDEYPTLDGGFTRLVIEPGLQHMDGTEALSYARTRHQDTDYARMGRQRCVIEAAMDQMGPADLLRSFDRIAGVIKDTVTTDIPLGLLPELVQLYPKMDLENVVSIRFIPPTYHLKYRDDGKLGAIANIPLVHEHVQLVLSDPERARVELGLTDSEECPQAPTDANGE